MPRVALSNAALHTASHSQQIFLQPDNSPSSRQSHLQFLGIEGLDDVVVGPRVHSLHQFDLLAFRRQQQYVGVPLACSFAQHAADLDAFDVWHHPIDDAPVEERFRFAESATPAALR